MSVGNLCKSMDFVWQKPRAHIHPMHPKIPIGVTGGSFALIEWAW
jgi:hypothetical protein